ncbi:TPA: hypothetical protein AB5A35_001023 [Vibrio cholerae]
MVKTYEHEMHSLAPYSFRCYNKNLAGKLDQRYSTLDKIGQYDLFNILKTFIQNNSASYQIKDDTRQVYQFSNVVINENTREIYGWFNVGDYGIKTDIIDIKTGKVDFQKAQNNAEIIKYYVHFYIPKGVNEAMAFLHSYRGNGIKTLFYVLFSTYFKTLTNLTLQMNPLAYDKAINAWLDAPAKEVKLTKFVGLADAADQIRKLGHHEQELIIKPPRRGTLGKLRDYLTQDNDRLKAVEVLSGFGSQVKTVVELNGKKRTFCVGNRSTNTVCEIELDDTVVLDNGVPLLNSMNRWVKQISKEYAQTMYPGMKFEVSYELEN